MKILVPVDGSSYTKRMLAYLAAHDEWLGDAHQYTVLHVVPAVPPRAAAVLDKEVLKGYYQDESEKVLKTLRTFFKKQNIQAEFVSKVGAAGEVIAATAEKGDFDLLILGSHGQSALRNLVLGSVATKVMANCSKPVLLIR
ncbi:nucleotide-binding universal stress UspA family protein [Paucibacter oligotrophus]|uniref:Nucleotide-binding universal stress UspA family protein n=1 Tax=Roseateles oligotrophus TaxID=1769250 RepID=A0A840L5V2_9BURK|nr:universal stress protein [Roseateles oligotrophus]MBB4843406.1 nucleotide-binding universal stress UspA family protein [Roseateles oligotrophus]